MPDEPTGTRLREGDPAVGPLDEQGPSESAAPPHTGKVPVIRHARDIGADHGPGFGTRLVAIVLAVLIGVAGGVVALTWLFSRTVDQLNPFDQTRIDRSGTPVLQSLTDLKTYQAASGYYEIVIDQETDVANLPSFLSGERVVFVAAGTVDATVDFSSIGAGSVVTNDERTSVTVALPAVQLGAPQLDLERSYVAAHQRGFLSGSRTRPQQKAADRTPRISTGSPNSVSLRRVLEPTTSSSAPGPTPARCSPHCSTRWATAP